jgi:maltose alpha-D-glucosyltransferase/alpha-amylase
MASKKSPEWLKNSVLYQIYPQSYYDSNGDGIGDLKGIIKKLDYIESLGVNVLWLNPCFESPFQDAGYDVSDFYKVAPRYGNNSDLENLFKEAHKRGMKVLLDLVAGHTSIENPWFKESCKHKRNKYSDWYIWTDSVWDSGDGSMKFINGYSERDGNFAINFFYSQPALNYGFAKPDPKLSWQQPTTAPGPQAVRAELKNIMKYWLDKGADGFRVDMAASLVKGDPDKKATIALWRELRQWFSAEYPEAALIAEWGQPTEAISAGFDLDFMFHCGAPGYPELFFNQKGTFPRGRCFFDKHGEGSVTEFISEYFKHYKKINGKGFISIPSGNHDFQRPNTGRNINELKVIFAFLLTWSGVPAIYYGDEIGMKFIEGLPSKEGGYGRTGTRTPMQWDDSKNAGFSSAKPEKLYLPIDNSKKRPTVKDQDKDEKSLLNHVRDLLELRKSEPALQADGNVTPIYAEDHKYPFIYLRSKGKNRFLVAVNPANKAVSASINFDEKIKDIVPKNVSSKVEASLDESKLELEMPGISYGIYQLI